MPISDRAGRRIGFALCCLSAAVTVGVLAAVVWSISVAVSF